MSQNADETYAWSILGAQLRTERKVMESNDIELTRLQTKRGETAARIGYLEAAITTLGGPAALDKAKAP